MDNQFYRVEMSDSYKLEVYVCDTNEINPTRDTKEIGIVVFNGQGQIDGSLNESEIDSLIKYLSDCRQHISDFNKNSKPSEE